MSGVGDGLVLVVNSATSTMLLVQQRVHEDGEHSFGGLWAKTARYRLSVLLAGSSAVYEQRRKDRRTLGDVIGGKLPVRGAYVGSRARYSCHALTLSLIHI